MTYVDDDYFEDISEEQKEAIKQRRLRARQEEHEASVARQKAILKVPKWKKEMENEEA